MRINRDLIIDVENQPPADPSLGIPPAGGAAGIPPAGGAAGEG